MYGTGSPELIASTIENHTRHVAAEGERFAAAAEKAGLEVPIPTCPGWNMRDLVRHLIEIHLWAAAHVDQPHEKPWIDDLSELEEFWPELAVFWPDDDALIDWYRATNANLVQVLESAPADLKAFTFLRSASPLAMWARRQAHETSVHRFDAENSVGTMSVFDPDFAADGIDELLYSFATRKQVSTADQRTIHVRAVDTDRHWLVGIGPEAITTTRDVTGPADLTLAGSGSDLYLSLWNRTDDTALTATGDVGLLETWHKTVQVRWED